MGAVHPVILVEILQETLVDGVRCEVTGGKLERDSNLAVRSNGLEQPNCHPRFATS
jgi:hypothetical protein